METTQGYTIVLGGSFLILLLVRGFPLLVDLVNYLVPLISKHLVYRYVVHRHQLLGP